VEKQDAITPCTSVPAPGFALRVKMYELQLKKGEKGTLVMTPRTTPEVLTAH
jgi:hypothetical protein